MRIVIDAREYPASTGRYIRNLLKYLQVIDANSEREYIVLLKSADMAAFQPKAKNFRKVAADFKEFTFAEQFGLLKLVWSLKADLVHFGKDHQPLLYPKRTVTTMHDLTTARFYNPAKNWFYFKAKQAVYIALLWVVAHKSKQIITISEFVKSDIQRYTKAPAKKIVVTYEAADPITDKPKAIKSLVGKEFLMYIGRPLPHKNLRRLIDAYAILKKQHPQLQLVLAGKEDDQYKSHLQYAKQNGIADITMTGFVSEGELRWLYEHCAAYVFPSLSEGFGLPGLEAMAHGAPVVSSDSSSLPEVHGDAAIYFDPLSVEDIATKILEVISDQKLRKEMSAAGKKQVANFSWERMAEQTLGVYMSVLAKD